MTPPPVVYLFVLGSLLPLLQAQATESTCQSGHYFDPAIRSCKPCVDICEPLRGTMPDCRDLCPDIYCTVVCNTNGQMLDKCFGGTCKEYVDKNIECSAKHTMPNPGEEKEDKDHMFSGGGIAVLVTSVLVTGILCVITTFFMTRRKYLGDKSAIEAAQEEGHQSGLDTLVTGLGETTTLLNGETTILLNGGPIGQQNGEPNGRQNGGPNGQQNGVLNGQLNGAPNAQQNGGPNGQQNGGPNGQQNGGPNGQQNGAPNGQLNGGQNGQLNGGPQQV